jgi:hypothetical protein
MTELKHHGVKGMKWGVRRYQNADGTLTPAGKMKYSSGVSLSQSSPKVKDASGDYIYPKGTVVGRVGQQKLDTNPMYLYTNEKDRSVYKNRFGGEEQKFILKKSVKIPTENRQIIELYKFTKDPAVLSDPYEYWKDTINIGGTTADRFFKHMSKLGYDALVDSRNAGVIADDPILLINPKACLTEVKKKSVRDT